jgi:broad specificity phosphatase PhoE
MTTILLVRHAMCDPVGQSIAGRAPGVHLNAAGRQQAEDLGAWLADSAAGEIYSGPLERARETAEPIARALGLDVQVSYALDELDFGDWTGASLDDLHADPRWTRFSEERSTAVIPGGERIQDVETRITEFLAAIHRRNRSQRVIVVSHGDVIRIALLHYIGASQNLVHRIDVAPASLSLVDLYDEHAVVRGFNVRYRTIV